MKYCIRRSLYSTCHTLLCAIVCVMLFAACSVTEPDGDWDAMKWRAMDGRKTEKGVYIVGVAADTLRFTCKNYRGPWISDAREDGVDYYPKGGNGNDIHHLQGRHFSATVEGNKLTVVFPENTSKDAHSVTLTVTAGDIFYDFRFLQEAAPAANP